MNTQTLRFSKKVYNDEQGIRRLGFYFPSKTKPFISLDLNVLEDLKMEMGEDALAVEIMKMLNQYLNPGVTQQELEYAVEDI